MNTSHIVKTLEVYNGNDLDYETWFTVIATHNKQEVCRCTFNSTAQYICKLIIEDAKKNNLNEQTKTL